VERRCPHIHRHTPLLQQSIDISCPPGPRQQTGSSRAAGLLLCARAETDRQTDGHRAVL